MRTKLLNNKIFDVLKAGSRSRRVYLKREETSPVLFSRGKKSTDFFTEDSKLYITPREQELIRKGINLDRRVKKWDSASSHIVQDFVRHKPKEESKLLKKLENSYEILNDSMSGVSKSLFGQFSMVRLWNLSMVGSILFGMVIMTFIYRYLGQGASAGQINQVVIEQRQQSQPYSQKNESESFAENVLEIEKISNEQSLEKEMREIVKGYPIEKMVPYIAKKDRTVAAFLIGIARKESEWGKHRPVLNGQDCYNYWGYRGQRQLMGSGGHTCFNSPKDAVDTVANRLETLIKEYNRDTPAKMVVWKCGSSCAATGGQAAANKWISDVTMYFEKLNNE